ncbi:hypothetical protein F4553_005067 [Allocatelliglobosispora scoriae]|uniref:Uncharacterized protein n=1 Tax=Allocatelliglobosispora scoriae TaxID=643052 RepID=A0A841BW42_9ACTN|nr:hypothetical protein [Allocatelliglobosispora scoriae]MBB5871688.1 hypothetical protein [Allocatelliglobosispora scoriae]
MNRSDTLRQREAMRRRIRAILIQRRLQAGHAEPPTEPAEPRD